MADALRRVSKYEHAFRAGRGEPVELAPEHGNDDAPVSPPPAPVPQSRPAGKK